MYCFSTVLTLPFGGVDDSGFGSYHGKFGFDTLVPMNNAALYSVCMHAWDIKPVQQVLVYGCPSSQILIHSTVACDTVGVCCTLLTTNSLLRLNNFHFFFAL